MSMRQIHWLANLIDSNSTITIYVQSQYGAYTYFAPQIIISKSDPKTIQTASEIVKEITSYRPFKRIKSVSRLVINGWKRCSIILDVTLPFLIEKRQHARHFLYLTELRKKIDLFKSLSALDIISDLQDLNRRTKRVTLLDVVLKDAYRRLSEK